MSDPLDFSDLNSPPSSSFANSLQFSDDFSSAPPLIPRIVNAIIPLEINENGVKGILRPSGTPGSGNGGTLILLTDPKLIEHEPSSILSEKPLPSHYPQPIPSHTPTAVPIVQLLPLPTPGYRPVHFAPKSTGHLGEARRIVGGPGAGGGGFARGEFGRLPLRRTAG